MNTILHIGLGSFHSAHQAAYLNRLRESGKIGDFGVNLLRTLKAHCDPAGIMNPGKLVPA